MVCRAANHIGVLNDCQVLCCVSLPGVSDGAVARVADVLVGDESGCVVLLAKGDQSELLEPGKSVVLHNAYPTLRNGFLRICVDEFGGIYPSSKAVPAVDMDKNLSAWPDSN